LTKHLNSKIIDAAIDALNDNELIGCVVLKDNVTCDELCTEKYNDFFSIKNKNYDYLITTQVSVWRVNYLLKILRRKESAWDFEMFGTFRARFYKEIILLRNDKYDGCIDYPEGGVLWRGKLCDSVKTKLSNTELDQILKHEKKNVRGKNYSFFVKTIKYLLSYLYGVYSLSFKAKRFGSPYFPKYIYKFKIKRSLY